MASGSQALPALEGSVVKTVRFVETLMKEGLPLTVMDPTTGEDSMCTAFFELSLVSEPTTETGAPAGGLPPEPPVTAGLPAPEVPGPEEEGRSSEVETEISIEV